MKVVQINATCGIGSTGKICVGISQIMTAENIENYILCSRSNGHPLGIPCSDGRYIKFQALKSRILGNYGFNSKRATKKMIAELERIQPDIVHLHNIHGHDCNLQLLFSYFARKKIRLYWTFHDCWAFTGYCPHFALENCEKWKTGCGGCPQQKQFSWFLDRSEELYQRKKELFSSLDLTIITPSWWLAELVKESFLKDCPVKVIPNGIDLAVFKPTPENFRERFGIPGEKRIVLGVSYIWDERKGLDIFQRLARELDPEQYQIVLVGTDEAVEKSLPDRILSIRRTQSQRELAEIYSAADVLVNPTREDTFPTVNLESLACGTPVITFFTGGSPEALDKGCGSVISYNDTTAMCTEVRRVCQTRPYSWEDCVRRGRQFDRNRLFQQYVNFYGDVPGE